MDKYTREIFKHLIPNYGKLRTYGFIKRDDVYFFREKILGGQFDINIFIHSDNTVNAELIDSDTGEKYTLFLVESAVGGFVGTVRTAYQEILNDIAEKCFDKQIFKNDISVACINYIKDKYGDELEFLWADTPDCAIWRRKDNRKWYGIMMTVRASKLGFESEEYIEIIDLRTNTEGISPVDGQKIFPGYHMNKKHWITVLTDGSTPFEKLCSLIDESNVLAKKK